MARKKGLKIPGVSFSANRALGTTKAKQKIAKATGIPTSKQGMERKIGRMVTKASGCGVYLLVLVVVYLVHLHQ